MIRHLLLILVLIYNHALSQNTYAIRDVSVISMTREGVIPNQTVIIEKGRITQIGSASKVKIPQGVSTIDGRNKFLMPGLIDMHTHFFQEQGSHRNTNEAELKLMLASGLTSARIMAGHPDYLKARENVKDGRWIGPDLMIVSPQFVGRWPWDTSFKHYEVATTASEAQEAVARFKNEGYDEIKITFMVSREVFDAINDKAKEIGIKVTGHIGPQTKLPAALNKRQQIEHMDEFIDMLLPDTTYNHGQSVSDMNIWRPKAWATVPFLEESRIPALVKMVKDAGIAVTPTNYFFFSSFGDGMTDEEYKQKADYQYIPEDLKKERWEGKERFWKNPPPAESRKKYVALRKKITLELWKAGVPLMAGSDSPEWFLVQGMAIHNELETFVKAGISPFGALQTATTNPVKYLGQEKDKGTVEVGKRADLLLLHKNPLEDIRNSKLIAAVFKNGVYFDSDRIETLKKEAKATLNP